MFNFTSPYLEDKQRAVRECPVGLVLRETPYVYDAISACAAVESGAVNVLESPSWLREVSRVVSSERARLFEQKAEERKAKSDAKHAKNVISNRRGGRGK